MVEMRWQPGCFSWGNRSFFFFFGVKFLGEFLGRIVVGEGEMRV